MSVPQRIGAYRIERPLGKGGMGEVYLARRSSGPDAPVALKVVPARHRGDPRYEDRLQREAWFLESLEHRHIVPFAEAGVVDGVPFVATEYIEGPTLAEVLKDRGPLAPLDALRIADQLLDALDHIHHHGFVHRDVKPSNVVFRNESQLVLCDFGLAVSASTDERPRARGVQPSLVSESGRLTRTGCPVGTFEYMSPEQRRGDSIDARTDLYSVGVILYQMLIGQTPCGFTLPSELRCDLPEAMDDLLKRALTDRARRFESASEMRQALGDIHPLLQPVTTDASPGSTSGDDSSWLFWVTLIGLATLFFPRTFRLLVLVMLVPWVTYLTYRMAAPRTVLASDDGPQPCGP